MRHQQISWKRHTLWAAGRVAERAKTHQRTRLSQREACGQREAVQPRAARARQRGPGALQGNSGAPQDADGIEGMTRNDWVRRGGLGIKEGAAVATEDASGRPGTLYLGFGLEGVTGADTRNQIMDRSIDYLLGSP